jgi:uncharacterized protein YjiS (DUF1127 family)
MKKIIKKIRDWYKTRQNRKKLQKKLAELKKRDPFAYKSF